MFLGLLQIISWIAVGYNMKSGNWWAFSTFLMLALFFGLVNAFKIMIGGKLDDNSSNKS